MSTIGQVEGRRSPLPPSNVEHANSMQSSLISRVCTSVFNVFKGIGISASSLSKWSWVKIALGTAVFAIIVKKYMPFLGRRRIPWPVF